MTKQTKRLTEALAQMSEREQAGLNGNAKSVLAHLRANKEYNETRNGAEWGVVYLDNARPSDMNAPTFRAALSTLAKEGLYRVVDGFAWGEVKL